MRSALALRRWTREIRPMLSLALPIMSGMLAQMLIGLSDTIMVGRVGVVPLAAAAFVTAIAHLPLVFGIGLLSSVAVLTAQAFGARQIKETGEVLRHGLVLGFIAGALSAALLISLRPFLRLFGQPPEVIAECGPFLTLFGLSMLPVLVAQVCKQFAESLGKPWTPMFIMLGGVLLNIFLNWIFIFGHWGAPAMGLKGAGVATLIARSAIALGLLLYLITARSLREFLPVNWLVAFARSRFSRLLHLGWPVAAQHLLEVSAFVFAAVMMGWINADAIAAHQIAITCAATSFMFALGTGMAACICVGHAWGAGQYRRMRRIGFIGVLLASAMMACFAVIFVAAGAPLARVFTTSPAVIALTVNLLILAAIFQLADATQIAAICALRGLADVRVPAMIAVLAYWAVAVPMGYTLGFPLHLGAVGIWIGLTAGLIVAAFSLVWRFHRKTLGLENRVPVRPVVTLESAPEESVVT
jgi:MATE family multidrug resistance protein